jgi:hypothetical protein
LDLVHRPGEQSTLHPGGALDRRGLERRKELKMSNAELRFGDRLNKDIKGPTEWKHPITGETLIVYERINQERDGIKSQLFAMNGEKTGLGRLYDCAPNSASEPFPVGSSSRSVIGNKAKPNKLWKRAMKDPGSTAESNRLPSSNWISLIRDRLIAWSSNGSTKNPGGQKSSTIKRIRIAPTKAW